MDPTVPGTRRSGWESAGESKTQEAVTRSYHQSPSDTDDVVPISSAAPALAHAPVPASVPAFWGPSDRSEVLAGKIGRYEIRDLLGQGGFGEVYLAWDPLIEREVALKVPRNGRQWDERAKAEFLGEARLAARIRDPRVVTIHDVGVCDTSGVYVAMELVRGESLAERLRNGPLPVAEACRIVAQAAHAIHVAHRMGIVHRDLKPANLLLTHDGQVKVTDFGLAADEKTLPRLKGDISGTLAYMSPEQLRGESHLLDGRSDVWSLGVLLYRLLTDKSPFHGASREEILEDMRQRPPKPIVQIRDDVHHRVATLCRRCLAYQAESRLTSAHELAQELESILRPRRRINFLLLTAALVVAVGIAWFNLPPRTPLIAPTVVHNPGPIHRVPEGLPTNPIRYDLPLSGPQDLLIEPPVIFVFNHDNIQNHYSHDPHQRRFHVQVDGMAMFVLGETAISEFELVVTGQLVGNTGELGVFWGLGRDADWPNGIGFQAATFSISRNPQFDDENHYLQRLNFAGARTYDRSIPRGDVLWCDVKSLPMGELARGMDGLVNIRVAVKDGRPLFVQLQSKLIEGWETIAPTDWDPFARGEFGFFVAAGQFVVTNAILLPGPIVTKR